MRPMLPALALFAVVALGGAAAAQPAVITVPWREGEVYAVTTTPGRVTDIVLEPGEELAGTGPVAAGDTARWIIGDSESGSGPARRRHVLVKPTAVGLSTNLIVSTDRRTYRIELRSTPGAYTASIAWRYPADELVAVRRAAPPQVVAAAAATPAVAEPAIERLNFGWRLSGEAPWKPVRVYDDGRRVVIEFPPGGEMPPLFELGPKGEAQLMPYRVAGRRIVVDRLFAEGELRLGEGRRQARVRLSRAPAP